VLVPLGVVWIPELRHYFVAPVKVGADEARSQLSAMPSAVCNEFSRFDLASTWGSSPAELRRIQQAAASYELALPRKPIFASIQTFRRKT
jgi:hypothetical protein